MKTYNMTGLRNALVELETSRLDEMLQAELEKESPDPDAVLLIASVLEERDSAALKDLTPNEKAAWQRYQTRISAGRKKNVQLRRWPAIAASLVLLVGLMFAVVPQQAEAETFWEMLQRWSTSVVEYFSRQDRFMDKEYTFKTDNLGLQQVYDAVTEMGVTEPVVPMWLPEDAELIDLSKMETPMLNGLCARFSIGNSEVIYNLDVYTGEPAHQYYKDDTHYESYERNGTIYNIVKNIDNWLVVCTNDKTEFTITIDCQEDTLRRILESIYVMEDIE